MEEALPKSKLKKIYTEILKGRSLVEGLPAGKVYLKHLTIFDSDEIDEINEMHMKKAKSKGLPTTEEKEKELLKDELWSEKEDKEINDLKSFISSMETTRSKLVLKSQIDKISEEISQSKIKLNVLKNKKRELIGLTVESYADKKTNDYYLMFSIYSDESLIHKPYSESEFDNISDEEMAKLSLGCTKIVQQFSNFNLKRIALSPFFVNSFCLVEDQVFAFYGKPVTELSFYQTDLLLYGKYFRSMMSEMKNPPPQEVMDDPDKLVEYFNISKNTDEMMSKNKSKEGAATTIVGATKEDLKAMGLKSDKNNDNNIDLKKEASKKGGSLSMEELLKLHGV
jgi:hypothetical protein